MPFQELVKELMEDIIENPKMINEYYKGSPSAPIHIVLQNGDINALEIISKYDIDYNKEDRFGNIPIHLAIDLEFKEAIELLLERGVEINVKDFSEKDVIDKVVDQGNSDIIDLFKKRLTNNYADHQRLNSSVKEDDFDSEYPSLIGRIHVKEQSRIDSGGNDLVRS